MGANYQFANGMAIHVKESNRCKFTHRIQLSNSYPLLVFSMYPASCLLASGLLVSCILKWMQIRTNGCKSCWIQFNDCNMYGYQMIGTRENHGWDFFCKIQNALASCLLVSLASCLLVSSASCLQRLVFWCLWYLPTSWLLVSLVSGLLKWMQMYSHRCKSCWIQFNNCNN